MSKNALTPAPAQGANDIETKKLADLAQQSKEQAVKAVVEVSATGRLGKAAMRRGGEMVVSVVAALAREYGIAMPGTNVDEAVAKLDRALQLAPIAAAFQLAGNRTQRAIVADRSDCWQTITGCYSLLSRMSANDPQLADALQPVTAFFAMGKESSKQRAVRTAGNKVKKTPKHLLPAPTPPNDPANTAPHAVPIAPAPAAPAAPQAVPLNSNGVSNGTH